MKYLQPFNWIIICFFLLLNTSCTEKQASNVPTIDDKDAFVQVSAKDPRYFELSNGSPYIPIGFNLVNPPELEELEETIAIMAANKINYCRIWLGLPLTDIEHEKSGVYDEEKAKVIDRLLDLAQSNGIKVKMCIEYFRNIPVERERWSDKPLHNVENGGNFTSMEDFLYSEQGQGQFKRKLAFYQKRFGDHPAVFAWELWNEMNATKGDWSPWTETMLEELQRLFPKNLNIQSLGSYDNEKHRDMYRKHSLLENNDIAQVHRYLDLGAKWSVCHEPIDLLSANAVNEIIAFNAGKPVILTETGAVKPRHTGCSELYEKDPEGMMMHDFVFAPFFAGAAGTGHPWWWRQSILEMNQWHHFARFANAVEGLNPSEEMFEPVFLDDSSLRIYILNGKSTLIAWCRDATNNWQSELVDGQAPEVLTGKKINLQSQLNGLSPNEAKIYDPWKNTWQESLIEDDGQVPLPDFKRSLVVRISYN